MAQMVVAQMIVSHKSTFPVPRFGSCSLAEGIGREQNMPVAAGCGHLWVGTLSSTEKQTRIFNTE